LASKVRVNSISLYSSTQLATSRGDCGQVVADEVAVGVEVLQELDFEGGGGGQEASRTTARRARINTMWGRTAGDRAGTRRARRRSAGGAETVSKTTGRPQGPMQHRASSCAVH
jgi:hypothetical protein